MHVIQLQFFCILGPPINPPQKEKKIKEETTHFGDWILAGKGKKKKEKEKEETTHFADWISAGRGKKKGRKKKKTRD